MSSSTKKLHFFRLVYTSRMDASSKPRQVQWRSKLSEQKRKGTFFEFGEESSYEAELHDEGTLIMGKRVDPNDYQRTDGQRFAPIADDNQDSYLARVNIAVLYDFNAFAVLGASAEAPGVKVIEALANTLDPGGEGAWKTEPIMSDPDISQFKKARKVKRMTVRTTVFPTNLLSGLKNEDYGSAFESFSDALGSAEVELTMDIKVKRPKNNQGAQDKLKQFTSVFMGDPGLKKLVPRV